MATLSTHVLDTAPGRPAAGIAVALERRDGEALGLGVTDADGRVGSLGPASSRLGDYVLRFDTGGYFAGFFPEVVIVFTVADDRPPPRAAAALAPTATRPTVAADLGPRDLVIRARRVIVGDAEVAACVDVAGGRIAAVTAYDRVPSRPDVVTSPTTRCCCPGWSTPTCTSTSRAAPSGRASPPRPGRPRPAA